MAREIGDDEIQDSLKFVGWWAVTVLTLVALDDLTTGPIFWVLTVFGTTWIVVLVAFTIYFLGQLFLVFEGTKDNPHRAAKFILDRLHLDRKNDEIARREASIHKKVASVGAAIPLSLVIGGVLPVLILYRSGYSRSLVRKLSVVTAAIYAAEFSYLHGYLPSLVV